MNRARVLVVVSEIYPLVKTGGLADVAGALPEALRPHGFEVASLVPGYPSVVGALASPRPVLDLPHLFGGGARILAASAAGLDLLVLDAPHLFARAGNPYLGPDGGDWSDNALRFGALGYAAARLALGDAADFRPDIVHGHDWQVGLAPAYLAYAGRPRPPTVMTIHNLAFQGRFARELLGTLRLPAHAYAMDGVEYFGGIGFLKAGLHFADRITTVSPTYAAEIRTPAEGFGLDGLLRARAGVLRGICNGIDTAIWNPATDPRIAVRYTQDSLAGRAGNKTALQQRFSLEPDPRRLLFGIVSRLTGQKGIDLVAQAMPVILAAGAQVALLGSGEAALEQRFAALAAAHPGRIGCMIGYDEDLAHLIQAGADALLVPSRFEPCGLTQLCALRYGAVPVVAKVGGLADTVIDLDHPGATGIQFAPVVRPALEEAVRRTAALWADQAAWRRLQRRGMAVDVSWQGPARRYADLYAELLRAKV